MITKKALFISIIFIVFGMAKSFSQSFNVRSIFNSGATGGVGNFAIDIMSTLGYEVLALTGKPNSHKALITLGAKEILDRHSIKSEGLPLEKGQWGGAIDNVGGDILKRREVLMLYIYI